MAHTVQSNPWILRVYRYGYLGFLEHFWGQLIHSWLTAHHANILCTFILTVTMLLGTHGNYGTHLTSLRSATVHSGSFYLKCIFWSNLKAYFSFKWSLHSSQQLGVHYINGTLLNSGIFKDDLAQVDYVDASQNTVHLKLIPRIDYTRMWGALK